MRQQSITSVMNRALVERKDDLVQSSPKESCRQVCQRFKAHTVFAFQREVLDRMRACPRDMLEDIIKDKMGEFDNGNDPSDSCPSRA